MNKVKGFEIVEQFLDQWKADCTEWWLGQWKAYGEALEERKVNPSEASKLYHNWDWEKVEAFLDTKFERDPEHTEVKVWRVPCRRNSFYNKSGYTLESAHNALVGIMNDESWKFNEKWSHVLKLRDRINPTREDRNSFEKVVEFTLQKEYERKYEKLVADCYKITGEITKADLNIRHASGNIEGFIHGEKGNAELWSTLSGGEVQCLHLRFYCHKR